MLAPASSGDSTEDDEESNLISRAAAGEVDAFSMLFKRYHPMIYAFAYRLILDSSEAHDIAQDTFIHAARALGRFSPARGSSTKAFRAWLYRIALNLARDRHRRRQRQEQLSAEMAARRSRDEHENPVDFTPVEVALAALPEDWRRALTLVFYEELSHAEAATILRCAETTVSWRIFQAKRSLRQRLLPPRRVVPPSQPSP